MQLETSSGLILTDPTREQIMAALATLPGGGESFAILSREEQVYVQAAGPDPEGFMLEYRDGSEDRHFQSVTEFLPLSVVQDVFERYARGDDSWHDRVRWEPWGDRPAGSTTVSRPDNRMWPLLAALGFVGLVAALMAMAL